jgi:hypothetical protein
MTRGSHRMSLGSLIVLILASVTLSATAQIAFGTSSDRGQGVFARLLSAGVLIGLAVMLSEPCSG